MNRRTLLAALPAAAVVPAAALAEAETPVAALFREWEALWFILERLSEATDRPEDDPSFGPADRRMLELEDAMKAAPKKNLTDIARTITAVTSINGLDLGDGFFQQVQAEARALIG